MHECPLLQLFIRFDTLRDKHYTFETLQSTHPMIHFLMNNYDTNAQKMKY